MSRLLLPLLLVSLVPLLGGCAPEGRELVVPTPEVASFELEVYPLLLRDCGFPACHGDPERFFAVFGPGRTRLSVESLPGDPPTADELRLSYDRARSMLVTDESVQRSWLLRKPLDKRAGGSSHEGADYWGRNVYASTDDPAYLVLQRWAQSTAATTSNGQGGAP